MKFNKKLLVITFCFIGILASTDSIAQVQTQEGMSIEDRLKLEKLKSSPMPFSFNLSFANMVPQGEFQDNLRTSGQGFSLFGGYTFVPAPITVGLQVDVLYNGGDTKYFNIYRTGGWYIGQDTVEYQNSITAISGFLKLQPSFNEIIYPFMEIFGGFSLISSSATLKPLLGNPDDKSNLNAAFIYGAGAGLSINVYNYANLPDTHVALLVDIKGRYMRGSETDYYQSKQINSDTSVKFEKYRSKTDMAMLFIGMTVMF